MAALEVAASCKQDRRRYVRAGLEYQNGALNRYRDQLMNVTGQNHDAIIYFSTILPVITLGAYCVLHAGGGPNSAVDTIIEHFELVRGAGWALATNLDCLKTNPMLRKMVPVDQLPKTALDEHTAEIFVHLTDLNAKRTVSAGSIDSDKTDADHAEWAADACRKAIFWLRICFETCITPKENRSYCLYWIGVTGKDYQTIVNHRDCVGLLILMVWATLLARLGDDYWWAAKFGALLVKEISSTPPGQADDTTRKVIQWARDRVQ